VTAIATREAGHPRDGVRGVRRGLVRTPEPAPGALALRFLTAALIPALLSADLNIGHQMNTGMIASFALAPIWFPYFVKVPAGGVFVLSCIAFLGAGFLLTWVSESDHQVAKSLAVIAAMNFAVDLFAVGALFWSCRIIGVHATVGIYAFVWLLDSLATPASWADNPWKFGFVLPVSLLVFSLVDKLRYPALTILAAIGLGAFSILNDSRSVFTVFILTAITLTWQRFRAKTVREPSLAFFLAAVVVVGGGAYYTITRLLVSGLLGTGLKTRSEAQVEASGSLLLGGRPEWTVTIRLFQEHPWGFGLGTIPSPADFELGRQGFASIHLLAQENYLKHYVFDGSLHLHSIVADLWAAGGPAGILLVVVMLWILLTSLADELAHRTATATQTFLSLLALWHIGFSPSYSNLHKVTLALAVGLAARAATRVLDERRATEATGLPAALVPEHSRTQPPLPGGPPTSGLRLPVTSGIRLPPVTSGLRLPSARGRSSGSSPEPRRSGGTSAGESGGP